MASIGMIFQFDSQAGRGEMMFAEGEKRSFTMDEWFDALNAPAVGQKVSCEATKSGLQIKVAAAEDQISEAPKEVESGSEEGSSIFDAFTDIEAYITYFTDQGFKRAKDMQEGISRTLAFRKLHMGDPIEVIVKQSGTDITVTQTVNGKITPLS